MFETKRWQDWKGGMVGVMFPEAEYQAILSACLVECHDSLQSADSLAIDTLVLSGLDKVSDRALAEAEAIKARGEIIYDNLPNMSFQLPKLSDAETLQSANHEGIPTTSKGLSDMYDMRRRVISFRFDRDMAQTVGAISMLAHASVNDVMRSAAYEAVKGACEDPDWGMKVEQYTAYQRHQSDMFRRRIGVSFLNDRELHDRLPVSAALETEM